MIDSDRPGPDPLEQQIRHFLAQEAQRAGTPSLLQPALARGHRVRRRRHLVQLAVAATVAAVAVGGITAGRSLSPAQPASGKGAAAETSAATAPATSAPATLGRLLAPPKQLIDGAPPHPDTTPDRNPRPDGYLYLKTIVVGNADAAHPSPMPAAEIWQSLDGTDRGVEIYLSRTPTRVNTGKTSCADPSFLAPGCLQQPASPAVTLAWLTKGTPAPRDVFRKGGMSNLGDAQFPAQSRSAIFQTLSSLPGVHIDPDGRTIAGQPGTALQLRDGDTVDEVVFDPRTFVTIGTRRVQLAGGVTKFATAVLSAGLVDAPLTRPDGSVRSLTDLPAAEQAQIRQTLHR